MQSTQLVCPYCGSTLNFGLAIAEGTPVECLICMRTFAAVDPVLSESTPSAPHAECNPKPAVEPVVESTPIAVAAEPVLLTEAPILEAAQSPTVTDTATIEQPAPSKPAAPPDEVLVAKPHTAPTGAVSEKPTAKPAAAAAVAVATTLPLRRRVNEASGAGTAIVITVALGFLFLLTGGIVIAAWKITTMARTGSVDPGSPQLAGKDKQNPKKAPDKRDPDDDEYENVEAPKALPPLTEEEEEELQKKLQAEVKQVLKRKPRATPAGGEPEPEPLPFNVPVKQIAGLDQDRINRAIDKGVAFLKRTQDADGSWQGRGHNVGHAAIGGLTLLECGVDASDSVIQKAAQHVRFHSSNLNKTYDISLAVLFLDRLGETKDRPIIQGLALRLLAGQNDAGGWNYNCPILSAPDMSKLYSFLQSHRQPEWLNPVGGGGMKTQSGIVVDPKRDLDNPFHQFNDLVLSKGIEGGGTNPKDPKSDKLIPPVNVDPKKAPAKKAAVKPIAPNTLPMNLQNLPIVRNQGNKKGQTKLNNKAGGDNSNTQFAMLALWAARRHNVPTEQALLASFQRFMKSQMNDGSWGYHMHNGHNPHTMTNVGLLGLAMGHGTAPELIRFNPKNPKDVMVKPALEDPTIQKGLKASSRFIGQPVADPARANLRIENLYMLWSIERVAMLYDLKTIGGKDWYGWGAQILVYTQQSGGEWTGSQYPGANPTINTCFGLLFLRRSNLVQDLTHSLRLNTGITESGK